MPMPLPLPASDATHAGATIVYLASVIAHAEANASAGAPHHDLAVLRHQLETLTATSRRQQAERSHLHQQLAASAEQQRQLRVQRLIQELAQLQQPPAPAPLPPKPVDFIDLTSDEPDPKPTRAKKLKRAAHSHTKARAQTTQPTQQQQPQSQAYVPVEAQAMNFQLLGSTPDRRGRRSKKKNTKTKTEVRTLPVSTSQTHATPTIGVTHGATITPVQPWMQVDPDPAVSPPSTVPPMPVPMPVPTPMPMPAPAPMPVPVPIQSEITGLPTLPIASSSHAHATSHNEILPDEHHSHAFDSCPQHDLPDHVLSPQFGAALPPSPPWTPNADVQLYMDGPVPECDGVSYSHAVSSSHADLPLLEPAQSRVDAPEPHDLDLDGIGAMRSPLDFESDESDSDGGVDDPASRVAATWLTSSSSDVSSPLTPDGLSDLMSKKFLANYLSNDVLAKMEHNYRAGVLSRDAIQQMVLWMAMSLEKERSEFISEFARMGLNELDPADETVVQRIEPPIEPGAPARSFVQLLSVSEWLDFSLSPLTAAPDDMDGVARMRCTFVMHPSMHTALAPRNSGGSKRKKSDTPGPDASSESAIAASAPVEPGLVRTMIFQVNEAYERLTGYTQADLMARVGTVNMNLIFEMLRPDHIAATHRIHTSWGVEGTTEAHLSATNARHTHAHAHGASVVVSNLHCSYMSSPSAASLPCARTAIRFGSTKTAARATVSATCAWNSIRDSSYRQSRSECDAQPPTQGASARQADHH